LLTQAVRQPQKTTSLNKERYSINNKYKFEITFKTKLGLLLIVKLNYTTITKK